MNNAMSIHSKTLNSMHNTRCAAESLRVAYYLAGCCQSSAQIHFDDAMRSFEVAATALGYRLVPITDETIAEANQDAPL